MVQQKKKNTTKSELKPQKLSKEELDKFTSYYDDFFKNTNWSDNEYFQKSRFYKEELKKDTKIKKPQKKEELVLIKHFHHENYGLKKVPFTYGLDTDPKFWENLKNLKKSTRGFLTKLFTPHDVKIFCIKVLEKMTFINLRQLQKMLNFKASSYRIKKNVKFRLKITKNINRLELEQKIIKFVGLNKIFPNTSSEVVSFFKNKRLFNSLFINLLYYNGDLLENNPNLKNARKAVPYLPGITYGISYSKLSNLKPKSLTNLAKSLNVYSSTLTRRQLIGAIIEEKWKLEGDFS